MTGCSGSPPNMNLAHLASTAFPLTLSNCRRSRRRIVGAKTFDQSIPPGSSHRLHLGALPRLWGLHQMEAAIGWLQRSSSRSEEGRVSWLRLKRNSSRSSDNRVHSQEVESCSVRRHSGFPWTTGPPVLSSGCWVRRFQLFWSVRRPDAGDMQLLTAATTTRILVRHSHVEY